MRCLSILSALALTTSFLVGTPLAAQVQSTGAITFLVPNLPGGSSDLIARAIGNKLQETLGRPVIIENRPGASEMIATELLARAAPDGSTIGLFSNALAINETLSNKRNYIAVRDLMPVAKIAELPFALIVSATIEVNSLKDFVAYAKNNPGKLNYGHVGVGAPHYLTMEWFKRVAGIDILPVPYKSSPPVYSGLLGGEIQVTISALGGASQFIQAGQLKALAAMSAQRPLALPALPTVAESGYPEFTLVPWMGVFAPAGTPVGLIQKLEADILAAANSPQVRQQLQRVGLDPTPAGAKEFSEIVKRDIGDWAKIIKDVGVKPE